jgi:type II secretory ATPase GspE/PulE/Tfp pilus assembly ATPase PilB-like protein
MRLLVAGTGLLVWLAGPELASAQLPEFTGDVDGYLAGRYGEFLSWYKLLAIVLVWLVWVFLADRVNRDLLRWSEELQMSPAIWNTVNVGLLLAGLAAVLLVPIFWIGWPVFLAAALFPPLIYRLIRRGKIKESAQLNYQIKGRSDLEAADKRGRRKKKKEPPADSEKMEFFPPGDETASQKQLILARQSAAFPVLRNLIGNSLTGRVDLLYLDYTRESVNGRMQIDGVWNPMPPLDREQGDALLEALKNLAGLNPAERRQKQRGRFDVKWEDIKLKATIDVQTQGVPTGEQAQIKLQRSASKPRNMAELGLRKVAVDHARKLLDAPGLVIVSAPQHGGLTTLWRAALLTSDRMTRDSVGILHEQERETDVENVQQKKVLAGAKPAEVLRKVLLTQPNVLVVPDLFDPGFADEVCRQATAEHRTVITRVQAASSAEAVLAVLPKAGDAKLFVKALHGLICQRMVRQLCPDCRVEMQVKPELIKKLGGKPGPTNVLYRHYVLPPVEQRVDERGKPVEMQPCANCQGTGFIERTAALEVITVNEAIRKAILAGSGTAELEKVFRTAGNHLLLDEAFALVLDGTTSMDEVRRVFRLGTPAGAAAG